MDERLKEIREFWTREGNHAIPTGSIHDHVIALFAHIDAQADRLRQVEDTLACFARDEEMVNLGRRVERAEIVALLEDRGHDSAAALIEPRGDFAQIHLHSIEQDNARLRAVLQQIVGGEYDNARNREDIERIAREALKEVPG
jgi:hypothetical protein